MFNERVRILFIGTNLHSLNRDFLSKFKLDYVKDGDLTTYETTDLYICRYCIDYDTKKRTIKENINSISKEWDIIYVFSKLTPVQETLTKWLSESYNAKFILL